jgi:hypothetical protein
MMVGLLTVTPIRMPGPKVAIAHTPDTHLPSLRHHIFTLVMDFYRQQARTVEEKWQTHAANRSDQERLIGTVAADLKLTEVADIVTAVAIARVTKCAPRVAFAADPDVKFRSTANTLRSSPTKPKAGTKEGSNELYINVDTKKTPSSYDKARQKIKEVCADMAWKNICEKLEAEKVPLALIMDLNNETLAVDVMEKAGLAAMKTFLKHVFQLKVLRDVDVVATAQRYYREKVAPELDKEEKAVLQDFFRTMIRLVKGTLGSKPSLTTVDALLVETSLIWSVAEAFRAPVALPYLLMTLMNLKHGKVDLDTAIKTALPNSETRLPVYAPSTEGASGALQKLFAFAEPEFHPFHTPFEEILRLFLVHYGFMVIHNQITPPAGSKETATELVMRKLQLAR